MFVSTVGIVAFCCAMLSMAIFPSQSLLAGLWEAVATSVITSVVLSSVGLPLLARIQRRALDAEKAIDSTDDGYWVLDNHGNFIDVNHAYCRMMGYDRSKLMTMSVVGRLCAQSFSAYLSYELERTGKRTLPVARLVSQVFCH